MRFWVQNSIIDSNVYFIFRDDGEEIRVEIKNGLLSPSKKITPDESNYLIKNFVNTLNKTLENEIIQHHLNNLNDIEISNLLNLPLVKISKITRDYWNTKKVG